MTAGTVHFPDEYWALEENGDRIGALELMEKKARETNDPDICFFLGQEFGVYSHPSTTDYARAFEWFSQGANGGDAACTYEAGIALLKGLGAPRDNNTGLGLIRKAAGMGNGIALDFLLSKEMQIEFDFCLLPAEVKKFIGLRAKHGNAKA